MARGRVFGAKDVQGFSPPGARRDFVSRLLIDDEGVGARSLVLNHFTLRVGKATSPGQHPAPFDEVYYVLHGNGLLRLGDPPQAYEFMPDAVAFIPSATTHSLENSGPDDLVVLTIMPGPIVEGANPLYDARLQEWGASLRFVGDRGDDDDGFSE